MNGKMSFYRSVRNVEPQKSVKVDSFLNGVREGYWRRDVERVRAVLVNEGEKAFKAAKASLPAVTPWGVFRVRRNDELEAQSGVMVIDLDGADNPEVADWGAMRDELAVEDWIYGAFISPSGSGIKLFVLVSPGADPAAVMGEVRAILETRNLIIDPSGKDAARACFVSWDPDCYVAGEDKELRIFIGKSGGAEESLELPKGGGASPAAVPQKREYKLDKRSNRSSDKSESGESGGEAEDDETRFLRYLDALREVSNRLDYSDWVDAISACVALWGAERAEAEMGARWPAETPGEYYQKCKRPQPCSSPHAMLYNVCKGNGAEVQKSWKKEGGKSPKKKAEKSAKKAKGEDDNFEMGSVRTEKPLSREEALKKMMKEQCADFYYDGISSYFWDSGKKFIQKNTADVKHKLKLRGFRRSIPEDCVVSDLDMGIEYIQDTQNVDYSGGLAGKRRGLYRYGEKSLLATYGFHEIEPEEGECPLLDSLVKDLFVDGTADGEKQKRFLFGWLQVAYNSLKKGNWRSGQCLVLAGERQSGKTLLKAIIVRLLGNRAACPYKYMVGESRFNSDLAAAECLVVDDEPGSTDMRARKMIANRIKSMLFSRSISIESKGREPFTFEPFWRMIFCVNDDPESLLVLPVMSEDMEDKISLLKCKKWHCPDPNFTDEERKAVDDKIEAELPFFLHKILSFEIPLEERENRCGIAFYHHPDLVDAMGMIDPENEMLGLIDECRKRLGIETISFGDFYDLERTAKEWERVLFDEGGNISREAQKLLSWSRASGVFMGKLARKPDSRVSKGKLINGIQKWRIESPEAHAERMKDSAKKKLIEAGEWFEVNQEVVIMSGDLDPASGAEINHAAVVKSRNDADNSYMIFNRAWCRIELPDGTFPAGLTKVFGWQLKLSANN